MKKWYTSKTILFNLLALVFVGLEEKFQLLQPYMHGDIYAYVAVTIAVANKLLRFVTTQAVMFFGSKDGEQQ